MSTPWTYSGPVAGPTPGDGAVTLVEGQTFCLSGRSGDIGDEPAHGLFALDTRVLSRWELRIDGQRLEPLAVSVASPFEATFVGRGHPWPDQADAELVVFRHRNLHDGMRERIVVRNYGLEPCRVVVELTCDADFADLFEVKEGREPRPGPRRIETGDHHLTITTAASAGRSIGTSVGFADGAGSDAGRVTWAFTLAPRQAHELSVDVQVRLGDLDVPPAARPEAPGDGSLPAERLESWLARAPEIETDSPELRDAFAQATRDLGALRIFPPEGPDLPVIAAGAPWFMALFGRDSLITAWMSLLVTPELATGVLATLARFQGTDVDPATEEEPGKILHEVRFGSPATLPGGRGHIYYGSIDATPLFVMLLGELVRWGLAGELLAELLPHADAALGWIDTHGDRDGDGYVEYQRATSRGLANQGWKDSGDAIRFADGRLARTPVALCEVQGYVYAAYLARADIARAVGDGTAEATYRERARRLKEAFNRDFWLPDRGWFALGLDADKRPIDSLASNMGHCLWTGIVDDDKAAAVARHLAGPELNSGWGVRTLAASMPAYNPVSYHRGSVWPHDTALSAAGLMRYGFVAEAHRLIDGLLGVAGATGGRLPELFAGFARDELPTPVAYPTSCSPQAWAAAAPLLIARTLLRLDPDVPQNRLRVAPALPPDVGRLRLDGVRVAGRRLTIEAAGGRCEVAGAGPLEVETGRPGGAAGG
ncbi:MAG TPA: glycogen debranching N-terminal domain-containing protein [Acidimicrobiales bacterium]